MTVRPSGSDDRWDVECVSEVSEKSPTHLAGAEANSGRLTAGDEKAMGSRGLASSLGWGVLTNTTEELSRGTMMEYGHQAGGPGHRHFRVTSKYMRYKILKQEKTNSHYY